VKVFKMLLARFGSVFCPLLILDWAAVFRFNSVDGCSNPPRLAAVAIVAPVKRAGRAVLGNTYLGIQPVKR